MNLDHDPSTPVSKPKKTATKRKKKQPKIKPGSVVTSSSAENARQLAKKESMKVNYPMDRPDSLDVERLVNDLLQKR